jgi:hypothetical protein
MQLQILYILEETQYHTIMLIGIIGLAMMMIIRTVTVNQWLWVSGREYQLRVHKDQRQLSLIQTPLFNIFILIPISNTEYAVLTE